MTQTPSLIQVQEKPLSGGLAALLLACVAAVFLQFPLGARAEAPKAAGVEIDSREQGRTALVRRTPGGAIDTLFGNEGRAPVVGMIPRSVTADAMGRLLVVGTSRGASPQPMLQRYTPNGHLDTSYGERGSSQAPPVSAAASAHDALLLPDGRTLVLGQLDDTGLPRPALWFVDAGGRFEPDWLQWTDTGSARAMSLTRFDGGALMVALSVPRPPAGTLEGYILVPTRGATALPELLVQNPYPKDWGNKARLERDEKNQWRWSDPDSSERPPLRAMASDDTDDRPLWTWRKGALPVATPVAAALPGVTTLMNSGSDSGAAVFSPFVDRPPVRIVAATGDAPDGDGSSIAAIGWSITGLLIAGIALTVFLRRRPEPCTLRPAFGACLLVSPDKARARSDQGLRR